MHIKLDNRYYIYYGSILREHGFVCILEPDYWILEETNNLYN